MWICTFRKVEFSSIRYLGDDLAGSEPGSLIGGNGSGEEEVEEVVEELVGSGSIGRISGGGEGGDEGNDTVRGGEASLEVEEGN